MGDPFSNYLHRIRSRHGGERGYHESQETPEGGAWNSAIDSYEPLDSTEWRPSPALDHCILGRFGEGEAPKKPDSNVTVAELLSFQKRQDVKYILVVFHAKGCKPCQVIKTPEYQEKIKAFNRDHPDYLLVSMDIGDTEDPLMGEFREKIVIATLPSLLFVEKKTGRYFFLPDLSLDSRKDPVHILEQFKKEEIKGTNSAYSFEK